MKKIFSIILAIIVLALSLQTDMLYTNVKAASSSSPIWNGLESASGNGKFTKGDGTKENPYIIQNGDQLYKMVYMFGTLESTLNGTPAYYKLEKDIYLNDISQYDKWGTTGFDMSVLNNWAEYQDSFCYRTFYGNLDGNGHTIYGLYSAGYRIASFLPNVGHGAVVKNVNFKYSYVVNTSGINEKDQEELGETTGEKVWYAGTYGAAGVLYGNASSAGDSDSNTVDFTIKNCSVIDAYAEAKYFTSAFIAVANSCQPYITNCMTANVTLNSLSQTQGVEGGIINMPYGTTNPTALIENVLCVGQPVYGVGRDEMWSGKKQPSIAHTYTFENVYSTVSNKFSFKHSTHGNLSYTDSEITVVDASKIIGTTAETTLSGLDWVYTWKTVDGGYPVPQREYVVPTGRDYYLNGGPKYSTDMWDGTAAQHFAAGDGSQEDPYLIANCEEFYLMATMPEADKCYKIANGVTDLYFNNIEGKSYSSLMSSFSSSWFFSGNNYSCSESTCFDSTFDGNGVIIHGVRSSSTNYSGLFGQVGNATLKNFVVRYSYFKTSGSSAKGAAAIIATVKENSNLEMKNVAVVDCTITGKNNAAGFIGNAGDGSEISIVDCICSADVSASSGSAYKAAFLASGTNCLANIKNSISIGIYPASTADVSYNATYNGVYTTASAPSTTVSDATKAINIVSTSDLTGNQAEITCKEFNWKYSWSITDSFPMPKNQQNNNGSVGDDWSGQIAVSYAGGDGTKGSPYQINTPEMLARMLVYGNAGEYYQLTADININDTTAEDWQNNAIEWFTSNDVSRFECSFDGNGYTIYGLYGNATLQDEYVALFPVLGTESQIKKVKLNNSYLTGVAGATLGGIAGVLEDNASVATNINACVVESGVAFYGEANVAGIIAEVGFSRAIVECCVFKGSINSTGDSYGIAGNVVGKLQLNECVSLNAIPFENSEKIVAKNNYTNVQAELDGVVVLETEKMVGIAARNNMTTFDFTSIWRLSTTDIPNPTGNVKLYNGIKGEVWSGKVASSFAKGNGSESNPYIIETGEQLALLITKANNYENKYFKLACDIYLNDVNSELWQSKSGALNWISSRESGLFKGHLDGNGYVVYGVHYNYKVTPSSSYVALIPVIAGSATVKNIGVSQAYIKVAKDNNSVYAGGIFAMGNAFYDFYNNKIGVTETEGDEFLIPGQTTPTKLPSITNCFVDHTCHIEATNIGGIGCSGGAAVVIRDCYVTASLFGADTTKEGSLLGANWAACSRIYNSFAFPQTDNNVISGSQQWVDSIASICTYTENVYYYGSKPIFATTQIKRPQWRVGEFAKEKMDVLDWDNVWRIEPDGTPVLRVFDKEERGAELFSDKNFVIPEVTVSFDTGVEGLEVEPIKGRAYEPIELPTPKRQGYKFVAWHAFEDRSLVYEYDYFLMRDITLYAEWKEVSVTQDFEEYPYTMWDCDDSIWRYNTPDIQVEYNAEFIHSGEKSMQLMSSFGNVTSLLLNYENTLTAGQEYTITFWTTVSSSSDPQFALAHKIYPDYMAADKLIELIDAPVETNGKWIKYEYTFTAQAPWIELKISDGDGIYIDDVVINTSSDLVSLTEVSKDVAEGEYYGNISSAVILGYGVTKVGEFGFAYSDLITDMYISDSVTQIDEYAFFECSNLTDIWYAGSKADFKNIVISSNNQSLKEATWHFNSCSIGRLHEYDNESDYTCNVCGKNNGVVGDVNSDGSVNTRDYAILIQYLNGWDVTINEYTADVNGDGSVNARDYVMLIQYISGWDVSFKK